MDFSALNPSILILEYNSFFGKEFPISTVYAKNFVRTRAHESNLYFGASLPALHYAAFKKGYSLAGCNLAGNNAYFVKNDLLNDQVKATTVENCFRESKFRESRNMEGALSYISGDKRLALLRGLELLNVKTNQVEKL